MKRKTERAIGGFLRLAIVVITICLQILLILLLVELLRNNAVFVYAAIQVLAVIEIVSLISRNRHNDYTIVWMLVIFLLPVFGQILYLLWGRTGTHGKQSRKFRNTVIRSQAFLPDDALLSATLQERYPNQARISKYLSRKGFPAYDRTSCQYYPLGELQFEDVLRDMEQANASIFMEFFILEGGQLWDRFRDVLIRKAAQGIDVRLMIDDMGSIMTAPHNLDKDMKRHGIKLVRFSPVHRYVSRLYINYRNHQKIVVIDGQIGYTGGTNLADEYANIYPKYGHWKDTAIRLEGDAVLGLSATFLQMWEAETGELSDYEAHIPQPVESHGFFQPFSDGPANNPDNPAEDTYLSIIRGARQYVYITTPYLVIDRNMMEALCTAALGGVDVRIITPKVWDHWYVHRVTQSNYGELMRAGARVYEYSPGYIHAKTIISDDQHAVTGSINMDYRSFNLHFENGVYICGAPVLTDIRRDIESTFDVCEEMSMEEWEARPWYRKAIQVVLRLFAVLL